MSYAFYRQTIKIEICSPLDPLQAGFFTANLYNIVIKTMNDSFYSYKRNFNGFFHNPKRK